MANITRRYYEDDDYIIQVAGKFEIDGKYRYRVYKTDKLTGRKHAMTGSYERKRDAIANFDRNIDVYKMHSWMCAGYATA
jgi:predicted component of viral defense system (DUF524 family)